jgi:type II secretory pathway component HofQ
MKRPWCRVLMICTTVVLMSLAGCAVRPQEPVQVPVPERSPTVPTAPQETPSPPAEPRAGTPGSVSRPAAPPQPRASAAAPPPSQAVVALLDTVDKRASAGNLDSAAAVLERALRLEPQNPLLWHRLAKLRLQQGQFAQAVNLAAKSNALAGNNRQLQAGNWTTIAEAKERLGDANAARAARERAQALQ